MGDEGAKMGVVINSTTPGVLALTEFFCLDCGGEHMNLHRA